MSEATPKKRRWPRLLIAALLIALVVRLADATAGMVNVLQVRRFQELRHYRLDGCEVDVATDLVTHRPGARAWAVGDVDLTFDEHGLRAERPMATGAPAGTVRLLALGSSTTLGWGVFDEQTFLRVLERDRVAAGAKPEIEMLNAGHVTFRLEEAVARLVRLEDLGPTAVLVVVDPDRTGADEQLRRLIAVAATERGLTESLLPTIGAIVTAFGERPRIEPAVPDDPRSTLRVLSEHCASAGLRLIVGESGMGEGGDFGATCRELGIAYVDLRFDAADRGFPLTVDDATRQPNALAHERIAQKLSAALDAHPDWLPGS